MPELGEIITAPSLDAELEHRCPFTNAPKGGNPKKGEDIANDDQEGLPENDGGILGKNLEGAKPGDGTEGPFEPTKFLVREVPNDSKHGVRTAIRLDEFKDAVAGDFPFTVAAHHLIPGNASLYKDEVKLINYMEDGRTVETAAGKSYKIEGHIGYDVNGSHNGVWLPGNYAIKAARPERKRKDGAVIPAQEGTTPIEGKPWSQLYEEWQYQYVAGTCKAGKGQFHDSHEDPYSASVRKNLIKVVTALSTHLDGPCEDCAKKEKVLPPPHRIKQRLYALSRTLRGFVTGPPQAWIAPWFTSQRWKAKYFQDGEITEGFVKAYNESKVIDL
ncbi:MAG TPA: hypothetical protein VGH98_17865 [Gemmatimonadaceae bacterium]|jgi:hypothetical protein